MNKLFSSLSFERNFWTTVNKENSKLQSSLSKVRKIDFGLMAQKQSWKKKKKNLSRCNLSESSHFPVWISPPIMILLLPLYSPCYSLILKLFENMRSQMLLLNQ